MNVSPCWKIFSTVFSNSLYFQRALSDGSTVVGAQIIGPVVRPSFDLNVRRNCPDRNSPANWIPKGESEHIRQSMSMDLRRRTRPWLKTGDTPPDRMDTRPEPGGSEPGGQAEAGD